MPGLGSACSPSCESAFVLPAPLWGSFQSPGQESWGERERESQVPTPVLCSHLRPHQGQRTSETFWFNLPILLRLQSTVDGEGPSLSPALSATLDGQPRPIILTLGSRRTHLNHLWSLALPFLEGASSLLFPMAPEGCQIGPDKASVPCVPVSVLRSGEG